MTDKFVRVNEVINAQRRDLFTILENDDKKSAVFIQTCQVYGTSVVISARDSRVGYEGRTLLHCAASLGLLAAVSYLLQIGHVVDCYDSSTTMRTPLFEAITANHQAKRLIFVLLLALHISIFRTLYKRCSSIVRKEPNTVQGYKILTVKRHCTVQQGWDLQLWSN
jgi:hypothetical protein